MSIGSKQQQEQQCASPEQTNQPTSSQQRRNRGRGGRSSYRGSRNRQALDKNPPSFTAQSPVLATPSSSNADSRSASQSVNQSTIESGGDASKTGSNSKQNNVSRGPRGGGSGGKYRQRQQMNQLIDGMDGLDIDLVESIAPTHRPNDSGKSRHPTVTRKVNLTHLLNHNRHQRGGQNHGFYNDKRGHHYPQTQYRDCNNVHKFNKQQFLQANCQFVVLPFHDYTVHKVDPDWPIDWDCIEEVKFRQTGATETTCPICLDPPVSAKITKCGHIYCWTCMLHYLSLSDDKSRQCPICFEPIFESDLRSVVSRLYSDHAVDEEINMRLMFRRKGCVEVEPYLGSDSSSSENKNDEHYGSQANLLIVEPSTVISEVAKREQDELLMKLELDRVEPEVCFVEQALDKLNKRIERLNKLCIEPQKAISNSQNSSHIPEPSTSQQEEKSFLFYQSSDGQHIYLNPFSTKILCHEFGSLENCPLEICAKILQMDWISMNESWRKRFKYLEHLPLTCEFRLIEIDFETSNLVSKETFALFSDQIKVRADERAYRKTEELKRNKIIQIEQNRRIYGIQPSLNINLDNMEQFPSVSENVGNITTQTHTDEPSGVQNPILPSEDQTSGGSFEAESPPGAPPSFKEIQARQEAAEARSKNLPSRSWASSKQGTKNAQQSSFAELLVDAKSSSKQWTRNVSSSVTGQSIAESSVNNQSRANRPNPLPEPDEDDQEELRAPPSGFTISWALLSDDRSKKRARKKTSTG